MRIIARERPWSGKSLHFRRPAIARRLRQINALWRLPFRVFMGVGAGLTAVIQNITWIKAFHAD
jgi:hypothetical protein